MNKQIQKLLNKESKECWDDICKLTQQMCDEIETDDQALIDEFSRKLVEFDKRLIRITNIALEHEENVSSRYRIFRIKKMLEDYKRKDSE